MPGRLKDEHGRWVRIPPNSHVLEPLEPVFGASCKPYALLTCRDVHPHRPCDAKGCVDCGFTGLSEIPFGTRFCCGVCWKSGKDHTRQLRDVTPPPDPPEPYCPDGDAPPETRKQRRSKLQKPSANGRHP